jgi:cobyrinic acid a,c-diamide synthase
LARPLVFPPAEQPSAEQLLAGTRIAVALDAAYAFTYRANLDL